MTVQHVAGRSTSRRAIPTTAVGLIALVMATELKFRSRDPLLSTTGDFDAQIVFELAVWAGGAVWLAFRTIRSGRTAWLNMPARLSKAIRALGVFVALIFLSSLYSPSPAVSLVRAGQWVILFGLVASLYADLRTLMSLEAFWIASRRAIWVTGALAAAVSAMVPIWPSFVEDYTGDARYHFFDMHPNATATILGLMIVTLVGSHLGVGDPLLRERGRSVLRLAATSLLVTLLLLTRTRGPIVATVVGVGVLVWLTGDRSAKRATAFGVLLLIGLVASGAVDSLIDSVIVRGQTRDQILTLTGRTDLFREALPFIGERLFFGHGYLAARNLFLNLAWGSGSAHNLFLEVIFSMGIVGVLALGVALGRLVAAQRCRLTMADGSQRGAAAESMALLGFLLVTGLVAQGFAGPPGIETLALMWSVLLASAGLRPDH